MVPGNENVNSWLNLWKVTHSMLYVKFIVLEFGGSLTKSPSIIFRLRSWLELKKKKRLKYYFGEMKYSKEQKFIKLWT